MDIDRNTVKRRKRLHMFASLLCAAAFSGGASAALVEAIKVGTWASTGAGNSVAAGGPGVAAGQRYVIKYSYDDASTTASADILTSLFGDSGQDMTTIKLDDPGNSLNIFVPMEGLDAGSPFIYTQDETTHFPAFIPNPTLNFVDGSTAPLDPADIIGLEYEGDYVTGGGFNIIEVFNSAAGLATPVVLEVQILNCGDSACGTSNVAATQVTTALPDAVPVTIDDGTVTYDATTISQTTTLVVQSNDLGAGRSDGQTFLEADWTEGGNPLLGMVGGDGANISVDLALSGLTNTISTATWDVTLTEQMTDLSDTGQVIVDYANANPTSSLSATANATGYDFAYSAADADLDINLLLANFEQLSIAAMVNGAGTLVFDDLIANGFQGLSNSELFAAFGAGTHLLEIVATDLAGAMSTASANFDVTAVVVPPGTVPNPATWLLMLAGVGFLVRTSRVRNRNLIDSGPSMIRVEGSCHV